MRKLLIGLVVLTVTVVSTTSASAGADRVTICHRTGSASKPYVRISPSAAGVFHGHLSHDRAVGNGSGGDIIPPFQYSGQTYSLDWDAAGQAIWDNGCVPPASPPPATARYRIFTTMPSWRTAVTFASGARVTIARHCNHFTVRLIAGSKIRKFRVFSRPGTFLRVKRDGQLVASAVGQAHGC